MLKSKLVSLVVIFFAAHLISSCGGGGGGSGSPSFSLSTESVSFTANRDDVSGPASVDVEVYPENGSIYIDIGGNASLSCGSSDSCTITIRPPGNHKTLPLGTSSSTVTVDGYDNQLSTTPIVRKTISVSYTIVDGLNLNPANVAFTAVESESPQAQTLEINSSAQISWSVQPNTSSGGNWLSTSESSGTTDATTSVLLGPLTAGSYSGDLEFSHNLSTGLRFVNVDYLVEPMLSVDPVEFNISESSLVDSLMNTVTINLNANATTSPNVNWSAAGDDAWFSLSNNAGDTLGSNTLDVNLDVNEVNQLRNRTYDSSVVFTPADNSFSPITVPVILTLNVPQFNYVSPNVVYTGENKRLIVRAESIGNNVSEVLLNGNPISVTQVNSTTLELDQPSLPEGTYQFSRAIPSGINNSTAILDVVAPQTFSYFSMNIAGTKDRIIYDAKRTAVLIASRSTDQIHRLAFNGSSWDLTSVSVPNIYDIELTPNSNVLLATNSEQILHIDPVSLTQIKAVTPSLINPLWPNNTEPKSIIVLNDGVALISLEHNFATETRVAFQRYSLIDDSFSLTSSVGSVYRPATFQTNTRRDRIVITFANPANSDTAIILDNAMLRGVGGSQFNRVPHYMHLSQTGDRAISSRRFWSVSQTNMVYLGELADGGTTIRSLISPDASRAYAYDSNGTIRTYDLTDNSNYWTRPEIGVAMNIPDNPGSSNSIKMELTPDGRNIIIGGDASLIIAPAP